MDRGKQVRGGAALAQALRGVINAGEDHVPDEGEDDRIRMQRADAAEGDVGETLALEEAEADRFKEFSVHLPPRELGGGEDADEHADNPPDDGGGHEAADGLVVVGDLRGHRREGSGVRRQGSGFSFADIKREEGIVLQAGAAAAAGLHGEADDKDSREA